MQNKTWNHFFYSVVCLGNSNWLVICVFERQKKHHQLTIGCITIAGVNKSTLSLVRLPDPILNVFAFLCNCAVLNSIQQLFFFCMLLQQIPLSVNSLVPIDRSPIHFFVCSPFNTAATYILAGINISSSYHTLYWTKQPTKLVAAWLHFLI